MTDVSELKLDRNAGVLTIFLDRPRKMNALTREGVLALRAVLQEAAVDENVRCLLLTGTGAAFCAGRDLSDAEPNEEATEILVETINPLIQTLYNFPKPTISAVNGAAMGIGLGLALACDICIASDAAVFSSPFAKLGGALDSGGHFFLSELIGSSRTFEMIYTGDKVGGRKALEWGLVNRVVSAELLLPTAKILARKVSRGPTEAFTKQKAILRGSDLQHLDLVLRQEALAQGELSRTEDYQEGLKAFREKRPPRFGRVSVK